MMTEPTPAFTRMAVALTAAGALPFIGLTLATATLSPPTNATAGLWLQTYSAIILSFLGGIRWGLALRADTASASGELGVSVLPALAGWAILPPAILMFPGPEWFLAYAALFGLHLVWDMISQGVPAWFKPARLWTSLVVMASLGGAWAIGAFGL